MVKVKNDVLSVEIDTLGAEMKNIKTFNMIVLGGLIKIKPIVSIENIAKALHKTLPERHHKLIPINEEALRRGFDIIKKD